MFRHNTGVDLNDFPALGAPSESNRGIAKTSLPLIQSSRLASYATTASTNSNVNHLQDTLMGNGAANLSDFSLQASSPLGNHQPPPLPPQTGYDLLAAAHGLAPRTFSVDEFPALRSSAGPFGNNSPMNKPEPWLSYGGVRENMPPVNGKYGARTNALESSQWLQERNDATAPATTAPLPSAQLHPGRKPIRDSAVIVQANGNKNGMGSADWNDAVGTDGNADSYGLLGLLGVIRMTNPDRSMLALGSDLTTLGLDLNTAESVT
ncbi:hypothetical protein DFQ28_002736 [Apophysomyces sp. BC1034]|nr:hypothetical protein DFQ29_002013 [Apophysomyces sp. BC1021]KAG0189915.1 hypothetical protein DFQ28_002736 [Apophysomyces sp. BC1034]